MTTVPRSEFLAHLSDCLADQKGFCQDMAALLKRSHAFDPAAAGEVVIQRLLNQLPN